MTAVQLQELLPRQQRNVGTLDVQTKTTIVQESLNNFYLDNGLLDYIQESILDRQLRIDISNNPNIDVLVSKLDSILGSKNG